MGDRRGPGRAPGHDYLSRRPIVALSMVGLGSAFGLAGTTLGILAAPLAILRSVAGSEVSRRLKVLVVATGRVRHIHLPASLQGGRSHEFSYQPFLGVSPPRPYRWHGLRSLGAGSTALAVTRGRPGFVDDRAAGPMALHRGWDPCAGVLPWRWPLWPRARWNRRLVLLGAAMIYCSYALTYSARTIMVKDGLWTEPQLLYVFASRYHVLPLLGLVDDRGRTVGVLAVVRRCDSRRGWPALIATVVGLVTMSVQSSEASRWNWMLNQPDQRTTLAAQSCGRTGSRRGRSSLAVDANLRPGLPIMERVAHQRLSAGIPPDEPGCSRSRSCRASAPR